MVLTVGRRQNWSAVLEISSKSFPLIPQNTRDIRGFRMVLEVRSVRLMVSNRSNIFGILAAGKGGYGVPYCTKDKEMLLIIKKTGAEPNYCVTPY